MTEDILLRATRALREISAEPEPRSGLTRARILRSAEARAGVGRSSWLRWALTIAGVLAAGGALARLAQHWPEARRGLSGGAEVVPHEPPRRTPVAPAETHDVPQRRAALPLPEATAGAPAPAPALSPSPSPSPEHLRGAAAAEDDLSLFLFRRARRLHLARDPMALGAWDDYLRAAPHGRHAPEARYARAVCLLRAGRIPEARAELEPFARGEYRGFRKREAQALLASEQLAP